MSGTDDRFERALGGSPLPPEDELGALVRDVREAFPAGPMLAEDAHLAAVAEAARRTSPEVRPADGKEHAVRLPDVKFPRIRSRSAAIVAGLVVVMSSFGGLAFAGALPGGVQDGVANVVASVGVDLPGGDDESTDVADDTVESEAPEVDESEAPDASETAAPEADDQGQNEDGDDQSDDQGENEQQGDQGQNEQADDQSDDQGENEGESDNGGSTHESSGSADQGDEQESDDSGSGGGDESGDGGNSGHDSSDDDNSGNGSSGGNGED